MSQRTRPPYGWAAGFGVAVFALYLATLAPTTAFWDTSEYIAAAKVLGIPHPPGNPLFTLTAHVFGLLPLAAGYAARINIYAAVTSALSAALWFLVAERWLESIVPVRWARLATAAAGALVGATSWTVWNQSTVNEKVYTFSLLSIALVTWLAVRWGEWVAAGEQRDRLLVCIAYFLALTWTNHTMGLLAAPAILVYILVTDWTVLRRLRTLGAAVLAAVVGVSVNFLYLPMRAGQYPPINEGEPAGFFSPDLMAVLNRDQYGKPPLLERQADFFSQVQNYAQYWSWQFARDWSALAQVLAVLFLAVGVWGLLTLWKRDRRAALMLGTLMATVTIGLVTYLNFKYGFSIHPDQPDLSREVRERDYFFVASFAAFGVCVALGLGAILRGIADTVKGDERRRWLAGTPVLLVALIPLFGNRTTASRAHETVARDFAIDLLESVEPYGILITAGDNDTFPLWYAQEVEGVRRDVVLANLSLLNTRWHLRQIRRRPVEPFDPATAISLWRQGQWPKPTEPTLPFTIDQLDSLPEVMRAPKNAAIRVDSVEIVLGGELLQLQDLAVIALIKQNLGKRPIFFSWSDGVYPDQMLGLSPYLVSQGLVRKLVTRMVAPSDSVVLSRTLGPINLPRTQVLLDSVYHWESAARERAHGWVDVPSSSILALYAIVYRGYAEALQAKGDAAGAARADSIAKAVQRNIAPH